MVINIYTKILYLIEQAGFLMQMDRLHKRSLRTSFDTIASHSHQVAIIAYCLARAEKLSPKEAERATTMAVFHDLPEARTGDIDFISKNYTKSDDPKAIRDQFKDIDFGGELVELVMEYEQKKTKISKIVRDADSLAQMYHEWVLAWQGNKLAEQWFEGDFIARVPYLFTETAKKLAYAMKESNPNEWWWREFVNKDGKAATKEHLLGVNYKK